MPLVTVSGPKSCGETSQVPLSTPVLPPSPEDDRLMRECLFDALNCCKKINLKNL